MRWAAKRDQNESAITIALQHNGWSVFPLSQRGMPDLLCVKQRTWCADEHGIREIRLFEVKEPGKHLTPAQLDTFAALEAAGLTVHVVTDPAQLNGTPWHQYHKPAKRRGTP